MTTTTLKSIPDKCRDLLEFRGWATKGEQHPLKDQPINFLYAMIIACDHDIDVFMKYCQAICDILGVKDMRDVVAWEISRDRKYEDLLTILDQL